MKVIDRFNKKILVNKYTGCWEWQAGKCNDGYGRFFVKPKGVRAHRYAYEYYVGEIPEGLQIDHLCRVRHCVNPKHMEPVTHEENCTRGLMDPGKARREQTHCKHGHPFSGDNLYITPKGGRACNSCKTRIRARDREKINDTARKVYSMKKKNPEFMQRQRERSLTSYHNSRREQNV